MKKTMEIAILTNDTDFFYSFKRTLQLCLEAENVSPSIHAYTQASLLQKNLTNKVPFDLIFLDMETDKSCCRLAEQINRLLPAPILILFAGQKQAVSPLLRLQPFRLIERSHLTAELGECMRAVLYELPDTVHRPCLFLESGNSLFRIPINRIRYIESINKQLHVHTADDTLIIRYPLGTIQQLLEAYHFLRIHKSFLANANCVIRIDTSRVILDDGTILPLSRYQSQKVRRQFREAFQWDIV